jgi:hypothetical protein
MKLTETNWKIGEIVFLPKKEELLRKGNGMEFKRVIGSRYFCIREAAKGQRGILIKILGQYKPKHIMIVDGEPYSKDHLEDMFEGVRYYSYPFPSVKDIKEVLDILRSKPTLMKKYWDTSVAINLQSKFWVKEIARNLLFTKKPQCYDAQSDSLCSPAVNEMPYRLTIAYFFEGEIDW